MTPAITPERNVPPPAATSIPAAAPATGRLTSIDAYRGLVMFLMMAEVMRFQHVAEALPGSGFWRFLGWHQSHVEWVGASLHDLIQPSFSFLVGVALPFSIASRTARGASRRQMTWHAVWRAVVLVLLGVFLRSIDRPMTYWTFEDTLSQIGLGYVALFALGFCSWRTIWLTFAAIVVGYWAAFALYPLPAPDFDYARVGVTQAWLAAHGLHGFAAHWQMNSNLAWAFDTWFLNLFPRETPFVFNDGGYSTLSFIPTLGTMILGLVAGRILRSAREPLAKVKWFVVAGVIGLLTGWVLGWLGICPVVKRIWTPAWTIWSGGACFLLLAGFYWVIDVWHRRAWAWPLVVIGMNSIAAYLIAYLFEKFIPEALVTHLGAGLFGIAGEAYRPLLLGAATLLIYWLLLVWMYRRKIFLKI